MSKNFEEKLTKFSEKWDLGYYIDNFVRSMAPSLSLVIAIAIMLMTVPSSNTDIFLFDLSYTQFMAKILVLVFMYNLGSFFIKILLLGGGVRNVR